MTTTTFSDRRSGAYLEFHATHNKLARGIAPSGQSRLLPKPKAISENSIGEAAWKPDAVSKLSP